MSNDGAKIDAERLVWLNLKLKETTDTLSETGRKHIGLSNVSERIKLYYGTQYGISVVSNDEITEFTIKIPFKK